MSGPTILRAERLVKKYAKTIAVNDLNLFLASGACLAILGPNGAGKTTLMEMLEGLLLPDSGQIEIFGLSYPKEHRSIMENIGVVLQDTALYGRYSALETLELFASFYQNPQDPLALLRLMDLEEKANAKLSTLSGGQRQRVNLACGLINDPKLIFLDEPTTGLDPNSRRGIWDLLLKLKNAGKSIILSTHFMEEAEFLADEIAIMDRGKIIARSDKNSLLKKYAPKDWLKFRLSQDIPPSMYKDLPWLNDGKKEEDGNFSLYSDKAYELLGQLFPYTKEKHLGIEHIEIRRSCLEDVFLSLTGRDFKNAN